MHEQYTEELFDYDSKKLELALDREPDVTKDRVSFKDSLKLLEVYSLQKIYEDNIVTIDGMEIIEKPQITI